MRWDIRQGLDGVITDDPKLFLEVRNSWHEGMSDGTGIKTWLDLIRINFFAILHAILFWLFFEVSGKGGPLIKVKKSNGGKA